MSDQTGQHPIHEDIAGMNAGNGQAGTEVRRSFTEALSDLITSYQGETERGDMIADLEGQVDTLKTEQREEDEGDAQD